MPVPDFADHLVMLFDMGTVSVSPITGKLQGGRCLAYQTKKNGIVNRYKFYADILLREIQRFIRSKPKHPFLLQIGIPAEGDGNLLIGLSGLLKTASIENPNFKGQVILLESELEEESLITRFLADRMHPDETEILYRNGSRYVRRLSEISVSENPNQLIWKEDGVYLITGGAGGLGLLFAREIHRIVPHAKVILTGRSALSYPQLQERLGIPNSGREISYQPVDVTDKAAIELLINQIIKEHGKLNGIIHSAGVIHDGFILQKTRKDFMEVLAPKVSGVVNLDWFTRKLKMDFVVCFSSGAGYFGNVGQSDYATANAFMDAISLMRNELVSKGLRTGRTLSINWPLWKEGGMKMNQELEKIMRYSSGMEPLDETGGIEAFYQCMKTEYSQVLVVYGDRKKLIETVGFNSLHSDESVSGEMNALAEDVFFLDLAKRIANRELTEDEVEEILMESGESSWKLN